MFFFFHRIFSSSLHLPLIGCPCFRRFSVHFLVTSGIVRFGRKERRGGGVGVGVLVHYNRPPAGVDELSRDVCDARRVIDASVGSTSEEGGNNLYQSITVLERSSSSSRICATPMKDLWSIRP